MAQRGRPKKIIMPPPSSTVSKVAEKLADICMTPGCKAAFHLEEAQEIISIVLNDRKQLERLVTNG